METRSFGLSGKSFLENFLGDSESQRGMAVALEELAGILEQSKWQDEPATTEGSVFVQAPIVAVNAAGIHSPPLVGQAGGGGLWLAVPPSRPPSTTNPMHGVFVMRDLLRAVPARLPTQRSASGSRAQASAGP